MRWGMHLLWRCYATLSSFIYLYLFVTFVTFVTLCSPHLYIVTQWFLWCCYVMLSSFVYISMCLLRLWRCYVSRSPPLYISICFFVTRWSLWRSPLVYLPLMFGQHIGLHCDHGLLPMSHSLYFGLQINDTFCNYSENQSHTLCVLWFISM